jgi:flagellar biogenesis protein FliO
MLPFALVASLLFSIPEVTPPFRADLPEGLVEVQPKPQEDLSFATWSIKVTLGLGFVVALIYLMGRFVAPKILRLAPNQTQKLRVLERLALDPKHAIFVVEFEGTERFLIGVSEQNVTTLAQLKQSGEVSNAFNAQAS